MDADVEIITVDSTDKARLSEHIQNELYIYSSFSSYLYIIFDERSQCCCGPTIVEL